MNTSASPVTIPVFKSGIFLSFSEDFLAAYEELKHTFKTKLRQKKQKKIKESVVVKTVLKDVKQDTNYLSAFYNDMREQVRCVKNMASKTVRKTLNTMFSELLTLIGDYSNLKNHLKRRSPKGK